jgi:uncharacterized protein
MVQRAHGGGYVKVEGTKDLDAPVEVVWEVLEDPAQMARLMPGVESFHVQDEHHWSAKVQVPLGVGKLGLRFEFEVTDERPMEYSRLIARGKGVGAVVSMETQFHLTPNGERTHMRWEADVSIGGPLGSMGGRMFQPIVDQQVVNVLDALERQVVAARAQEPA